MGVVNPVAEAKVDVVGFDLRMILVYLFTKPHADAAFVVAPYAEIQHYVRPLAPFNGAHRSSGGVDEGVAVGQHDLVFIQRQMSSPTVTVAVVEQLTKDAAFYVLRKLSLRQEDTEAVPPLARRLERAGQFAASALSAVVGIKCRLVVVEL